MEHTQLGKLPKERFMKSVRQELDAFEKRERKFLADEWKDRTADMKFDVTGLSNKRRKLLPAVAP